MMTAPSSNSSVKLSREMNKGSVIQSESILSITIRVAFESIAFCNASVRKEG